MTNETLKNIVRSPVTKAIAGLTALAIAGGVYNSKCAEPFEFEQKLQGWHNETGDYVLVFDPDPIQYRESSLNTEHAVWDKLADSDGNPLEIGNAYVVKGKDYPLTGRKAKEITPN